MKRSKKAFWMGCAAMAWLVISIWGCQNCYVVPPLVLLTPTSTPSPSATPTVNLTPVCGMTPVSVLPAIVSRYDGGVSVIRTNSEWSSYINGNMFIVLNVTPTLTPTPAVPPVDFNSQMLVVAAVSEPGCANGDETITITNVCEGPTQVTVYATITSCISCAICNVVTYYDSISSACAVPQSNLPVTVIYTFSSY